MPCNVKGQLASSHGWRRRLVRHNSKKKKKRTEKKKNKREKKKRSFETKRFNIPVQM